MAGELRGFLAKFLFTGDDVYKHVRDLSGGEKGRLALAKLIYSRVNVLVLDEPTNHLDIPSREALEEALDAYDGTIIAISHDRYFLDRIATQILALDGRGRAEYHDGDYTEYHDWKAAGGSEPAAPTARPAVEKTGAVKGKSVKETLAAAQPGPKPDGKKTQGGKADGKVRVVKKGKPARARDPQLIEADIAAAEKRLAALTEEMSSPVVARSPERFNALNAEYTRTDEGLKALFEEWERAAESANA